MTWIFILSFYFFWKNMLFESSNICLCFNLTCITVRFVMFQIRAFPNYLRCQSSYIRCIRGCVVSIVTLVLEHLLGEVHVDCHKYFIGIDTCMYTTQPWNLSVMCDELYVNRPTDKLKTLLKYCLLPLFYKLRDTIDFQWHSPAVCFGLF